ncbi:MAG: hypothetical protein ACK5NU_08035 [Fusobacterium ulcerans]|uniref:hypothetical protein n=1 Tax=Fusobacterium ulcerans TaxID=861 RepID=UPI003A8B483F
MKKLLLLASILAMSGVAFAAEDGKSDSADLKVKAQIIQPLKVTTKPVDFGVVAIGQSADASDGEISIFGEVGSNISIEFSDLNNTANSGSSFTSVGVVLVEPKSESKLLANLMISDMYGTGESGNAGGPSKFEDFKTTAIPTSGELKYPIYGYLPPVPENTASGFYEGAIKVTATYTSFPVEVK